MPDTCLLFYRLLSGSIFRSQISHLRFNLINIGPHCQFNHILRQQNLVIYSTAKEKRRFVTLK